MTPVVIMRCKCCGLKFVFQGTIDEAEDSARSSGWKIEDGVSVCQLCQSEGQENA